MNKHAVSFQLRVLKTEFMKKVNVYGVEMTSIQEMKFSQFLNKGDTPAMNTLTEKERFDFTNEWLNKNK